MCFRKLLCCHLHLPRQQLWQQQVTHSTEILDVPRLLIQAMPQKTHPFTSFLVIDFAAAVGVVNVLPPKVYATPLSARTTFTVYDLPLNTFVYVFPICGGLRAFFLGIVVLSRL